LEWRRSIDNERDIDGRTQTGLALTGELLHLVIGVQKREKNTKKSGKERRKSSDCPKIFQEEGERDFTCLIRRLKKNLGNTTGSNGVKTEPLRRAPITS